MLPLARRLFRPHRSRWGCSQAVAYAYSGEGYQIAQLVVGEALGIDVSVDLERRFFDRLQLQRSGLCWKDRFGSDFDTAYDVDGTPMGHDRRPRFDAAGSMNTSIGDFTRFTAAFVDSQIVSVGARRALLSPQLPIRSAHQFPPWLADTDATLAGVKLAAGLGVFLWEGRQGRGFFKGGHDYGGDTMVVCLIERSDCVVLMMNAPKGHLLFPQIVEQLLGPTDLPWSWEYSELSAER